MDTKQHTHIHKEEEEEKKLSSFHYFHGDAMVSGIFTAIPNNLSLNDNRDGVLFGRTTVLNSLSEHLWMWHESIWNLPIIWSNLFKIQKSQTVKRTSNWHCVWVYIQVQFLNECSEYLRIINLLNKK